RNDQVALDLHLFAREAAEQISAGVLTAMHALVEVAETDGDLTLLGYTHLQRAQPILLSHHLLAHFEALRRDLRRFEAAREAANVSPLGAAALAGTPHPVDPSFTAAELGMEAFTNSLDAVSERDFVLDLLFACAVLGMHLSRLGEEWVLWTSAEFGFATLGDAYSSGSSIMPQKKNPDVPELARGKTGRVVGHLMGLITLMKGQPLAYNKDNQEDKEPLFDTVDTLKDTLRIFAEMIGGQLNPVTGAKEGGITVNAANMRAAALKGYATATDLADYLVKKGLPFRDAHETVAHAVKLASQKGVDLSELPLEELQTFNPNVQADVFEVLSLEGSLNARNTLGGTAPAQVRLQLAKHRARLA
ncbi:MAG TPA: argininosuccinate lyase, partial [Comamonas sp.]